MELKFVRLEYGKAALVDAFWCLSSLSVSHRSGQMQQDKPERQRRGTGRRTNMATDQPYVPPCSKQYPSPSGLLTV